MGRATIAIVIVLLVFLLLAGGFAVWWFFIRSPPAGEIPQVCSESIFYKKASSWDKTAIAKACALQQPARTEKTLNKTITSPTGFKQELEMTAVPIQRPAWCKDTYYAGRFVDTKGNYGPSSGWNRVPSSTSRTLPSMSWDAGVYTNPHVWNINVYRSLNSDGSKSTLMGKGIYDPIDARYAFIDYELPTGC